MPSAKIRSNEAHSDPNSTITDEGRFMRRDWRQILINHYSRWVEADGTKLILIPPITTEIEANLKETFGFSWTDELFSLYRVHGGAGFSYPGIVGVNWFIVRPHDLPQFVAEQRSWISKTHPQLAESYFPFVDCGGGDSMGYVRDDQSKLYMFNHEMYSHDASQSAGDFLIPTFASIEEFLGNE